MDWNAVCDALEAIGNSIPGMNAYSEVPDSIANIGFVVGEIDIDFNATMKRARVGNTRNGTDQAHITIRILVARFDDKAAQRALRSFMSGKGPTSVVQALEGDRTLGGTVDDSRVVDMKGNRLFTYNENRYYGVELTLFVIGDA